MLSVYSTALNDLRNLQAAVDATNKIKKQEGRGESQIALSYTLGDAYTLEYWADMAKKIEEMGADSICIKDMAGLLVPYKAAELVKTLEREHQASYPASYTLHLRCCFNDIP